MHYPLHRSYFPDQHVASSAWSGFACLYGAGDAQANPLMPLRLRVEIDIRPWSEHNFINPFSRLLIPVALLGSDDFDVANVDVTTLAFAPGGAAPLVGSGFSWNVNADAFTDLVSFYRTPDTGIALGDTEACLTGQTLDGRPFQGCDAISTVSCGLGVELVFLLPPLIWLYGRRRRRMQ